MPMTRNIGRFELREHLRQSLWFIPTLCVAAAATAAIALVAVDAAIRKPDSSVLLFGGGADGARQLLTSLATSMFAFIGTVFSVTILVLQLASSQFSPRSLRGFLRDRRTQPSLGIFLATLVYALVVVWTVRGGSDGGESFVPHVAITGAYGMVAASLATFVFYIHHVSQSVRLANVVHHIGAEALAVIEARYPDPFDPAEQVVAGPELCGSGQPLPSTGYGVLVAVDEARLAAHAEQLDGRVEVVPYVGDFVPRGGTLARWSGDAAAVGDLRLEEHVSLERERTMEQDIGFACRQLVDIAEKALSPALNDPTTAGQSLDQLHNILRQLGQRTFPHEVRFDAAGTARLVVHERHWSDIVHLAFDEIRDYGSDAIQVRERLSGILDDLMECVPEQRRPPLQEQIDALEERGRPEPRPR